MLAKAADYVSLHVGASYPLMLGAAEDLVKQYADANPDYKDITWNLFPDSRTVVIEADGNQVILKLKQVTGGMLTASVTRDGPKMEFEPVDYRNSAAGNGSEILTGLW